MEKLSKMISSFRRMSDMTQEQLAIAVDVSTIDVDEWEKGESDPDVETLCKLADCFEVTVDELLGRNVDEQMNFEFESKEEAVRFNFAVLILECCTIARNEGLLAVEELVKEREKNTNSFLKFAVAYLADCMRKKVPVSESKEFLKRYAENERDSWTAKMVCEGITLVFAGEREEIVKEVLQSFLGRKFSYLISVDDQMKRWNMTREEAIEFYAGAENGFQDTGILQEVLEMDDFKIQRMIRHAESDDLLKAVWGTSKEVRERLFRNMSNRMLFFIGEEVLDFYASELEVQEAQEFLLSTDITGMQTTNY